MEDEYRRVPLDLIDDPHVAMRSVVDDEELEALMASMREIGLRQPIEVRPVGVRYEVVIGHRRTRAARLLGWPVIKAIVRDSGDEEALAARIAENVDRKNVHPVDEAAFLGEIMLRYHKSVDELVQLTKRKREWVENRLEIFEMPDYMKEHLKQERYPLGAALWISKIENEQTKRYYAMWAAVNGVSVAGAKRWYETLKAERFELPGSDVEIRDEGGQVRQMRRQVPCYICDKGVFLDEARSVWVHENCEILWTPAPPGEEGGVNSPGGAGVVNPLIFLPAESSGREGTRGRED